MGPRRSTAETLAAAAASFRGERIGKYEILAQLSLGGMAELFLGYTSGPGGFRKYVVVKRILPDVRENDQFVKMFLDEARITAALDHPNIAQVFDLGEERDGLYLAMEFIAGQNLNQIMEACVQRKSALPLGFTAAVCRDIALALHYAHTFTDPRGRALPVIHRDVAQKNIMVAYDGRVKLLDFGIAKARGSLGRTQVGTVKGTTGYMSPEQVLGQEIDGRSDVFCLGVVMHELFTGKRLFAADTEEEEMRKILTQPIPKPARVNPSVPEELSDVVMRALAREKADRFASARDLARAIEGVLGKTLFDQDRTSQFMRELFERKLLATQALLESVDSPEPAQAEKALLALRSNDGMVFNAPPVELPPRPADVESPKPRAPSPSPASASPASPPAKKAAPARAAWKAPLPEPAKAPPAPPKSSGMRTFWVAVFAVLGATVGVGAYATWDAWHPKELKGLDMSGGMQPLDPNAVVSPQKPAPTGAVQPGLPTTAQEAQPGPSSGQAHPEGSAGAQEGAKAAEEPAAKHPHHELGKLTLITQPSCEVFLGKKKLGKTPLFNVSLPAGLHELHLRGADRKLRRLSVPIRAGKTSAMKISLADLPTR